MGHTHDTHTHTHTHIHTHTHTHTPSQMRDLMKGGSWLGHDLIKYVSWHHCTVGRMTMKVTGQFALLFARPLGPLTNLLASDSSLRTARSALFALHCWLRSRASLRSFF